MDLRQRTIPGVTIGVRDLREEEERKDNSSPVNIGVDTLNNEVSSSHECLAPTNPSWDSAVNNQISTACSAVITPSPSISDDGNIGPCLALQWNLRGLRNNISELKTLIAAYEPTVIALQETKVDAQILPSEYLGKNYTISLKTGSRSHWQHGVGLAIRSGIPFEWIELNGDMQAIAARILFPLSVTIVSIYFPPNSPHYQQILNKLFDELTGPILILGDFNAHHAAWGSNTTDSNGRLIAELTLVRNLIILNSGSHTRLDPATGISSAIDITISSESIANRLTWNILPDTHNSDHFPICVGMPNQSQVPRRNRKWLYEQADWAAYESITACTIQPSVNINLEHFTNHILAAATACIPRSSGKVGSKAVPWWCKEVQEVIKNRRKALRFLRRLTPSDICRQEALLRFQKARCIAKKVILDAKRKSWEKFVKKISPSTPAQELWHTVNALRGKRSTQSTILKVANGYTDNPKTIAEELAKHYRERSATSSYPPTFQTKKEKAEQSTIDHLPDTNEYYNSDFTVTELLWALDRGRSVSTGPDQIGYPMLRRLPLSVKIVLLDLFNHIWRSGIFPSEWRTGVIVPLPKENANETGPAAFRPITLTNCVAKVFERMVNRRLICELEASGRIDNRQHAFRAGYSTDTYFADLERYLPSRDEHSLIASLDLSKAYDTTWHYGILRTLSKWLIKGRMFNILKRFLSERFFKLV